MEAVSCKQRASHTRERDVHPLDFRSRRSTGSWRRRRRRHWRTALGARLHWLVGALSEKPESSGEARVSIASASDDNWVEITRRSVFYLLSHFNTKPMSTTAWRMSLLHCLAPGRRMDTWILSDT